MREATADLTLEVTMRAAFGLRHGRRYDEVRADLVAMRENT